MERTYTPEEIAKTLSAAMDSVNLLAAGKPQGVSEEDWVGMVARNKDHLALVVSWEHMQGEDLQPLLDAIEE